MPPECTPDARHTAGCRRDKIHLPQVQHAGRVLRIPAAIYIQTLSELHGSVYCISWPTEYDQGRAALRNVTRDCGRFRGAFDASGRILREL